MKNIILRYIFENLVLYFHTKRNISKAHLKSQSKLKKNVVDFPNPLVYHQQLAFSCL